MPPAALLRKSAVKFRQKHCSICDRNSRNGALPVHNSTRSLSPAAEPALSSHVLLPAAKSTAKRNLPEKLSAKSGWTSVFRPKSETQHRKEPMPTSPTAADASPNPKEKSANAPAILKYPENRPADKLALSAHFQNDTANTTTTMPTPPKKYPKSSRDCSNAGKSPKDGAWISTETGKISLPRSRIQQFLPLLFAHHRQILLHL